MVEAEWRRCEARGTSREAGRMRGGAGNVLKFQCRRNHWPSNQIKAAIEHSGLPWTRAFKKCAKIQQMFSEVHKDELHPDGS